MTDETKVTTTGPAQLAEIQAKWAALAESIPDAASDDGSGAMRIATQIFDAQQAGDLDSPWEARDFATLLNKPVKVTALRKAESDYPDGPGFYLIVDVTEVSTGEMVTVTTGSVSVMAQLIKAYAAGWMPLICVLTEAERPTKQGYRPQHLMVL